MASGSALCWDQMPICTRSWHLPVIHVIVQNCGLLYMSEHIMLRVHKALDITGLFGWLPPAPVSTFVFPALWQEL